MPYAVYKLMHFLGIFMLITALAATSMHVLRGGSRTDNPYRRVLGAAHGIAAALILTGGFGMLARLGVMHGALPTWIYVKLAIWVTLAAAAVARWRSTSRSESRDHQAIQVAGRLTGGAPTAPVLRPLVYLQDALYVLL